MPPAFCSEGECLNFRVHKRTLANLSSLSAVQIDAMRAVLAGRSLQPAAQALEIIASRPHGHVQAVTLAMQRLGFASLLGAKPSRERERALAMVAARIVAPHTKLATSAGGSPATLAEEFGVADANEDTCTRRSTGCSCVRIRSRRSWPRGASAKAAWCCTTCLRATSRARRARCAARSQSRRAQGAAAGELRAAHRCARLPGGGVGA